MTASFSGQVVVVTGAARGIGEAICRKFAANGASVALCDRLLLEAQRVADEIRQIHDCQAIALELDIGDAVACGTAMESVVRMLGPIDVLVNNAGITKDGRFVKLSNSDWSDVVRVNLTGCFNMAKAVVPSMVERKRGKIINIASRAVLGSFGQANYSASKAGIVGLTRTLAIELGREGINVNAVAPGFIKTPMTESVPREAGERILASIPLGRPGEPTDVANVVAFLASDEASYVTGQLLYVCGGRSLGSAVF